MCATAPPATCSETPHPTGWLAQGHSRSGTTEPEAARELTLAAAEIGRNDWAAPEPVTGIFSGRADAGTSSQEAIMKRIHHEDFTFYDHEQTSRRIPERDEREARDESRARDRKSTV